MKKITIVLFLMIMIFNEILITPHAKAFVDPASFRSHNNEDNFNTKTFKKTESCYSFARYSYSCYYSGSYRHSEIALY